MMNIFTNSEIHKQIGTVYPGSEISVDFSYCPEVNITKFESPCDCSTPYDIRREHIVRIKYVPKDIPVHLIEQGRTEYEIAKQITVYFTHPSAPGIHEQKLLFTGVVKRR